MFVNSFFFFGSVSFFFFFASIWNELHKYIPKSRFLRTLSLCSACWLICSVCCFAVFQMCCCCLSFLVSFISIFFSLVVIFVFIFKGNFGAKRHATRIFKKWLQNKGTYKWISYRIHAIQCYRTPLIYCYSHTHLIQY